MLFLLISSYTKNVRAKDWSWEKKHVESWYLFNERQNSGTRKERCNNLLDFLTFLLLFLIFFIRWPCDSSTGLKEEKSWQLWAFFEEDNTKWRRSKSSACTFTYIGILLFKAKTNLSSFLFSLILRSRLSKLLRRMTLAFELREKGKRNMLKKNVRLPVSTFVLIIPEKVQMLQARIPASETMCWR